MQTQTRDMAVETLLEVQAFLAKMRKNTHDSDLFIETQAVMDKIPDVIAWIEKKRND